VVRIELKPVSYLITNVDVLEYLDSEMEKITNNQEFPYREKSSAKVRIKFIPMAAESNLHKRRMEEEKYFYIDINALQQFWKKRISRESGDEMPP
jgi:hypothetical protein